MNKNKIDKPGRLVRVGRSARVVELADTPDLGSGAVRREGSSPSSSTNCKKIPASAADIFYFTSQNYKNFASFEINSTQRLLYPHSLSYQLTSLKNRSFNWIPEPASKIDDNGQWIKSDETTSSVV